MPSMFRRPLTPKTFQHLKDSYFFKTTGEKFKNVRQSHPIFLRRAQYTKDLHPPRVNFACTYSTPLINVDSMIRMESQDLPLLVGLPPD